MTNASSASHVHRNLAHLVPHLSPLPLFKVEASAPSHTPSLDPQGMDSLACPPLDVLLRNVCDLTESTKIIGTKPFAHGGFSDIWRGCEWGAGATRDVSIGCLPIISTRLIMSRISQVAIKIVRVARKQDVGVEKLQKVNLSRLRNYSLEHCRTPSGSIIETQTRIVDAYPPQNILPFYGLCWLDGPDDLPAMVFPYCESGTCVDFLTKNPDIRQVAAGLSHLHSRNPPIAHGDIKATNILMKEDGTPLIADFGLSRLVIEFSTGLTTSSSKGSCRWMAPELFGGIDSQVLVPVTTASDVWAFGCLCIEILLGIVPWATTRNDAAIILGKDELQHRKTPPLPESTSSVPVGHIMSHCWAYEPSHRPSMVQLVNALRDVDPEWLHTSVCTLLLPMPTVLSDSPPPIRNSDSDSFTRTFGESPLISGSQTETRTKTPIHWRDSLSRHVVVHSK
ncbi:protein tyrosine kinase domain-containing protein [Rhizoctonia solani AG-1 IA]|uniref:Protein tyrosine kinase domain-containing protein n=1 Tax=Thanatephorus cucumeris (strain AG1-IA) TaxID=983506 RepID=L8WIJ7_THACA|nr:protein tyrosine kinase domain-containing protein [Rhizoctonia solani AG-1 IA]